VAEVERRYRQRYIPGQQLYFAEANPAGAADVVLVNDDPARPTLVINYDSAGSGVCATSHGESDRTG
jgi:hypothetical protein